jgi:hypothetical protein
MLRFWNCTPIGLTFLDKFCRILGYMRHGGLWQSFVFSCFGTLLILASLSQPLRNPECLGIEAIYIASFFYYNGGIGYEESPLYILMIKLLHMFFIFSHKDRKGRLSAVHGTGRRRSFG